MSEVVDLNEYRKLQEEQKNSLSADDWAALVMKKNKANKERLRKAAEKDNKSVIRAYRLKK